MRGSNIQLDMGGPVRPWSSFPFERNLLTLIVDIDLLCQVHGHDANTVTVAIVKKHLGVDDAPKQSHSSSGNIHVIVSISTFGGQISPRLRTIKMVNQALFCR